MALTRHLYDIALNTPEGITTHQIAVAAADRLRAELEAPKHKLTDAGAQHTTTLWLWAACTRLGLTDVGFQEFKHNALEEFGVVVGADGKHATVTVDPTVPSASVVTSPSPSPSPLTSEAAPATGSTPPLTSSTPPSS